MFSRSPLGSATVAHVVTDALPRPERLNEGASVNGETVIMPAATRNANAAAAPLNSVEDWALADLQDEARQRLPVADLMLRVVVVATAPGRSAASVQRSDPGMARLASIHRRLSGLIGV